MKKELNILLVSIVLVLSIGSVVSEENYNGYVCQISGQYPDNNQNPIQTIPIPVYSDNIRYNEKNPDPTHQPIQKQNPQVQGQYRNDPNVNPSSFQQVTPQQIQGQGNNLIQPLNPVTIQTKACDPCKQPRETNANIVNTKDKNGQPIPDHYTMYLVKPWKIEKPAIIFPDLNGLTADVNVLGTKFYIPENIFLYPYRSTIPPKGFNLKPEPYIKKFKHLPFLIELTQINPIEGTYFGIAVLTVQVNYYDKNKRVVKIENKDIFIHVMAAYNSDKCDPNYKTTFLFKSFAEIGEDCGFETAKDEITGKRELKMYGNCGNCLKCHTESSDLVFTFFMDNKNGEDWSTNKLKEIPKGLSLWGKSQKGFCLLDANGAMCRLNDGKVGICDIRGSRDDLKIRCLTGLCTPENQKETCPAPNKGRFCGDTLININKDLLLDSNNKPFLINPKPAMDNGAHINDVFAGDINFICVYGECKPQFISYGRVPISWCKGGPCSPGNSLSSKTSGLRPFVAQCK